MSGFVNPSRSGFVTHTQSRYVGDNRASLGSAKHGVLDSEGVSRLRSLAQGATCGHRLVIIESFLTMNTKRGPRNGDETLQLDLLFAPFTDSEVAVANATQSRTDIS